MSGKSLSARIAAVSTAYSREFATQNRRTRDPRRLDELLVEARAVAGALERKIGALRPDEKETLRRATQMRDLLTRERKELKAEQARPEPTAEELAIVEPAGRATVYGTLLRAGAQRDGRLDLALLLEVVEGFERCEADMAARTPTEKAASWMIGNLNVLRSQVAAIRAQHDELLAGYSPKDAEQRRVLRRQLADGFLFFYRDEPRVCPPTVRRQARWRQFARGARLVARLVRECIGLTGGDADLIAELEAVADRAENQAEELISLRSRETAEAFRVNLEEELATLAFIYRKNFSGRARKDADLSLITDIAIRSANVALQAAELWSASPSEAHEALWRLSRQRHHSYQAEEDAIRGWKEGRYK